MNRDFDMSQDDIRLRERLRQAVRNEPAPPFLEARIRARIQAEPSPRRGWFGGWALAGSMLAVVAAAGIAYELGHLRFTAASQHAYVAKLTNQVATIMRVGLGDHLHCAHFRKFPAEPPPLTEFVAKMGREYAPLIPVVRENAPAGIRMELAHKCKFQGREFVHLAMKSESRLMSLVIARKSEGESFAIEGLLPSLVQSGSPVYRASARKFEIAAFETKDHLVYLVSDLPGQENMDRLLAMAPGVRNVLARIEVL